MQVTDHLAVSGQMLNRLSLPDGLVAIDIVQDFGIEHKKSAVDPPFSFFGLLVEFGDVIVLEWPFCRSVPVDEPR